MLLGEEQECIVLVVVQICCAICAMCNMLCKYLFTDKQFVKLLYNAQHYTMGRSDGAAMRVSGTALHCTVLYCTVLRCTALHCTALHCNALYCTALHCSMSVISGHIEEENNFIHIQ